MFIYNHRISFVCLDSGLRDPEALITDPDLIVSFICKWARNQSPLVTIHLVMPAPAYWVINRADGPSTANVWALSSYHMGPPQLPVLALHGYRGLVLKE